MQVDVRILGGLPVTVEYETAGHYDNSDVGFRGSYESWEIVAVAGKTVRNTDWIMRRIAPRDLDAIEAAFYS